MDPGSFFLMLIAAVVVIGGGIVLVAVRMLVGAGGDGASHAARPVHNAVSTPYHDHTDMIGTAGKEPDRTSSSTEHQVE